MYGRYLEAEVLIGKTITSIIAINDEVIISTSDGKNYKFLHNQDCCEDVQFHSVQNLDALIGQTLTACTKTISNIWPKDVEKPNDLDSFTWTTVCFVAGDIVRKVVWLGLSNGYYGESIDLEETRDA